MLRMPPLAGARRRAAALRRPFLTGPFAALVALAATVALISGAWTFAGDDPSAGGRLMLIVLWANLALVLALAAYAAVRVLRWATVRKNSDGPPRLHLRFVTFLTGAALIPTLVVAVLGGVMVVRVLDGWFSERVQQVVDNSAEVAKIYLAQQARDASGDLTPMVADLNQPDAVAGLQSTRIRYVGYLTRTAELSGFKAAFVIDRSGVVLARAALDEAAAYQVPGAGNFAAADNGGVDLWVDRDAGNFYLFVRLNSYPDAYLQVVRDLSPGATPELRRTITDTEIATVAYREAAASRARLQLVLILIFAQITVLIVIGAAWLGVSLANRIVAPIGRLVRAAEQVRDGDLEARVLVTGDDDEVTALARTFNQMTGQLASQRSELVSAHDIAEERRHFTEAVLAGVSAGVLGVNAAGRVTIANRSALWLLDVSDEAALMGADAAQVAPEFTAVISAAREEGGAEEADLELIRGERVRTLRVRADASDDDSVVVTFDDISGVVAAQRTAAWRDVARRIAHEIKNPLTPIQLSAERLRRRYLKTIENDPETFERCVDTIVRQVGDIGRLIDEFSAFARMPEPQMERVEAVAMARDAAFALDVAHPRVAIAVDVDAEADDIAVHVDERLVAQALGNLMKNAAEAVERRLQEDGDEDAKGHVTVRVSADGSKAILEIIDDGVGWPAMARERLVEPYVTTRERGTGLGLAIVRRVMEDHHGALELDDRADGERGAVVRLVLPLHRDSVDETAPASPSAPASEDAPHPDPNSPDVAEEAGDALDTPERRLAHGA